MKVTDEEINEAVATFCELSQENKTLWRGCRRAIPMLARETARSRKPRRRLGRLLIRRYRRDTGEVGGVRWDAFREWLKEHMAEINFARLIVSILMLLILI